MRFNTAFVSELRTEKARLESLWAPEMIVGCGISPDPDDQSSYAWTDTTRPFPITFNGEKFGAGVDPRKVREDLRADVLKFGGLEATPADVLLHEYGHVVSAQLSDRKWRAFGKELGAFLGVNNTPTVTRTQALRMARRLSLYGVVGGPPEAMAESFVLLDKQPNSPAAQIAEKYLGQFRK